MMPEPPPSPPLARLRQAIDSAPDLRALFQAAVPIIREIAGCERISLFLPVDGPQGGQGLAVEFTDAPHFFDVPAADLPDEERRLFEQGYRACVFQPLLVREKVVGVLGLAARRDDGFAHLGQDLLDTLACLLALALDNLALRARVSELERFQRESTYLRDEAKAKHALRPLTGESMAMKAVRRAVQQVAGTDSTVLILGETGTGKELIARAIHQLSPRRERLLVAVNCAALAPGVLASELFGHEQGAFTGATRRRLGRFELAHRGTLFLDEVGELPAETQVLLLRALQEGIIERVGGQAPVDVDVRLIAATHRDLAAEQAEGRFRADLFYRLNVFPILVPPLRQRREDIPDLVRHFLQHFGRRLNSPAARVGPAGMRLLQDYHWPGNVRELENLIERAVIVAAGETLEVDPHWLTPAPGDRAASSGLAGLERQAILDALARCGDRIYGPTGAAAVLGLKPTTLYGKLRKHGIVRRQR